VAGFAGRSASAKVIGASGAGWIELVLMPVGIGMHGIGSKVGVSLPLFLWRRVFQQRPSCTKVSCRFRANERREILCLKMLAFLRHSIDFAFAIL
jgi:hypothetical protein